MIKLNSRFLSLIFSLLFAIHPSLWATISSYTPTTPANLPSYYNDANNKSGSVLFTAMTTLSGATQHSYTKLTYDELYTAYHTSDVYPSGHTNAGKIWDMYSTVLWVPGNKECGSYSAEGGCYNREHSMPKSWFGGSDNYKSTNQGCDLVHLVPTDGYVNGRRSNYAFGEVASASYTSNGGLSKLGSSKNSLSVTESTISGTSVSGISATVFEPDDEYKGDFARIYMYMRARYASLNLAQADGGTVHFSTTTSPASDSKYGFKDYSVILLMKWHRQDPVSQKEIDRNNQIEKMQGNRNPFVDYPIIAEYLWGKYAGQTFSLDNAIGSFDTSNFTPGVSDGDKVSSTTPTLSVSATSLDIASAANSSNTATFTITGANLTSNITIAKSGTNSNLFTISPTSIAAGSANATNTITVTYSPTATGSHTATLTISSTGATSKTVTLNGTCAETKTVTWKVNNATYTTGNPTTQVTSGSKVTTLPTAPTAPSSCSGKTFVGWTATAINSETNTAPMDLFTDVAGSPVIDNNTTFYAVFATVSGGGNTTYTLANSIASGDKVVIACSGSGVTAGALNNTYLSSVSSTFSGTTLSSVGDGTLVFTVGGSSGAWTLSNGGNLLGTTAAKSVNLSGNGTTTWTINISSGTATITSTTSTYGSLKYNSGSPRFTTYASGQTAVQLYKVSGGTSTTGYITTCTACTPSTPSASFDNPTTSVYVGSTVTNTVATTSDGDITYSSNNTSVATVNATTGEVTGVAAGSATITASIAASDCYYAKTATYTITVNAIPTYTVTWHVDGSTTPVVYNEGATLNQLADPSACANGRVFKGWTTTSSYSGDGSDLITSASGTVTANADYYAVYATATTISGGSGSGGTVTETMSTSTPYVSQTDWTASAGGAYTTSGNYGASSPSIKLSASNQYVQSATMSGAITAVSYWYKPQNATGTLSFYVSTDGSSFTELTSEAVSFSNSSTSGTKSITLDSSNDYRAIKIVYTKTTSNVAVDDIEITYSGGGSTTTYSEYSTSCTTSCTPEDPVVSFASAQLTKNCTETVSNALSTGGSTGTVQYSSSKTSVATVNPTTGEVSIVAAGITTITANVGAAGCYNAAQASYTLTVTRQATTTTFSSPTSSLTVGESVTNTATTTSDQTVNYSSNNTSVVTVDASGKATAVAAGTATITASVAQTGCLEASSDSYTITVGIPVTHTVTWYVDGTPTAVQYNDGAALTLPASTPSTCANGRVFKGWTATANYSNETDAPVDLFTTASGTVTADATYYAVYASETTTGGALVETDDFELYSGSITEGDYLITYDGNAMNTTVTSNRLQFTSVTPDNDVVTTTESTIIWHIAPSGNYWTIYNADGSKYAAATGTKNQATTSTNGSDDKSLWTVSGEETYEFVNKNNAANSVNANLRKNTTYGFACYNTQTGGALTLYKRVTTSGGSGTTTTVKYSTSCSLAPYEIIWNATTNGGDCSTTSTEVPSGSAISAVLTELPTATKEGYTFNGWYTAATGGSKILLTTVPTDDAEYFAQFTPISYTITYASGANGTGTVNSTTKTYGVDAILSSNTFTRAGYAQDGWSTTDGGDKTYDLGGTYTANEETTLYPHWSALPTITVTFKVGADNYTTFEGWEGKSISGISTPIACSGYTFVGWSTQQYGTTNTDAPTIDYTGIVPASNTTYYAVFSTSGVAVGTTLWAENFAHFDSNTPSAAGIGTGTIVYSDADITYTQSASNSIAYAESLAGGTSPELLLAKSSTTWTISGIKMANATAMSLTFMSNKATFSVTTNETTKLTVSGSQKSWTISVAEGQTAPETFNIIITNTGSNNARIDNVQLVVTAIDDQGAVFTTSKTFTITVQSLDDAKGTVNFE